MEDAEDLFGKSTFLSWLPGETFFSLISRHHYFWGNPRSFRTCDAFFGHRHAGSQHDLPSRLSRFVATTAGQFGNAEQIAKEHTLLGYYASFLPPAKIENAFASMAGDNIAHLKFQLGILTSRFRANHPLKACTACMREDRAAVGWAYWHVEHQYPGVWICAKHAQFLNESTLKSTGVERFLWHLPNEDHFLEMPVDALRALQNEQSAFLSLSLLILALVALTTDHRVDTSRLFELYRIEIGRRGWLNKAGGFRMHEIATNFLEFSRHLRVLPEFAGLPATLAQSVTQLNRFLRPPRSGTHPLRHLVLIDWLFESAEVFLSSYTSRMLDPIVASEEDEISMIDLDGVQADPRHKQLFNLVSMQSFSMRKAAKTLNIDVGTAMTWAAKAGIASSRRPKKMTENIREAAISALRGGQDKAVVAINANVSVVTITKLLLSEVGLHATWIQSRALHVQTSARQTWVFALQEHTHLGIKYLRALNPSVYLWLYRNDRAWLDEHKPERLVSTIKPEVRRLLWDARDEKFCAAVKQAALDFQKVNCLRKIKLWQLLQLVPELKSKLPSLNQLPLTRQAIDQALLRSSLPQSDLFS